MPLVRWSEDLSVGVKSIDTQHQQLVDVINALHEALYAGKGAAVATEAVDSLEKYAASHFAHEEGLMRRLGYPETDAHVQKHRLFVDKVKQLRALAANPGARLPIETQTFLRAWLVQHIRGTDQRYAPFLSEHGVV